MIFKKMLLAMAPEDRFKVFKKELDELLKRHEASLSGEYEGDTHGISSESFTVTFAIPKTKERNYGSHKDFILNPHQSSYQPEK